MSYANEFIEELKRKNLDFSILLDTTTLPIIDDVDFDEETKSLSFIWLQKDKPLSDTFSIPIDVKKVNISIKYSPICGDVSDNGGCYLSIYPSRKIEITGFDVEPVYEEKIKDEIRKIAAKTGYEIIEG